METNLYEPIRKDQSDNVTDIETKRWFSSNLSVFCEPMKAKITGESCLFNKESQKSFCKNCSTQGIASKDITKYLLSSLEDLINQHKKKEFSIFDFYQLPTLKRKKDIPILLKTLKIDTKHNKFSAKKLKGLIEKYKKSELEDSLC